MTDNIMLPEAKTLAERKEQVIEGLERVILEVVRADSLGEFTLSIENELTRLPGAIEISKEHTFASGWHTVEMSLAFYKECEQFGNPRS